ncbi:TonB-dependent receptor domain-containing protein [Lentisalinibacter orientalis]|uniref:TonB-dependent receptor domain-containing protein n=1 Tax=Lentisalinibacter orientalis TaxID=2992241 RepID=UPI00386B64EC
MNVATRTATRLGAAMAVTVTVTLAAVAAQAGGAPAWTSASERSDSPAGLDTLIVTATRTPIPASESLVPVTVITREQIERSLATDVLDLLRFEAGLDVARTGGPGQAAAVFVRGSESNHALVLIDGVRINPGTIGAAPLQNLAPSVIQRIEIVKGVRSSLYGTDAIGGVINIITRGGRERSETAVRSGSFDTRQIQTSLGRRAGAVDLGLNLDWTQTDGFPTYRDDDSDRGYDNFSANAHAGLSFGPAAVTLRHWQATGTTEYSDFFRIPVDQDYLNAVSALEVATPIGGLGDTRVIVSHLRDEIEQNQLPDFVESERSTLDLQHTFPAWRGHTLMAGAYLVEEDASALSFGLGFDEDTSVRALFLQDLIRHRDHEVQLAARYTDHSDFGGQSTWNAEYGYRINPRWRVSAGIGTAFRAPDATDRFGFGGNPDLEPETAREAQLVLRYSPAPDSRISVELYHKDIDDLIEFDLAAFRLRNIDTAEIRGLQVSWDRRWENWEMRVSAVRQQARDGATDERLLRRAEKSVSLTASRDIGRHTLGLSLVANGDRAGVGGETMGGYLLTNVNARLRLSESWRLTGRIENLLDRDYETAAGFNMAGRSGYLELGYVWR